MGRDTLIKIADAGEWSMGLHSELQALIFQLKSKQVPMGLEDIRDLVGSVAATQARTINAWYKDSEELLRFVFELRAPENWKQVARGKFVGGNEWRRMESRTIRLRAFVTLSENLTRGACPTAIMLIREQDDNNIDLIDTWEKWQNRRKGAYRS